MAIVTDEGYMYPAADFPLPTTGTEAFNRPDYNAMGWRLQYESGLITNPAAKVVFYFHGSGATQPANIAWLNDLLAAGYIVFQPMQLGYWVDPLYACPEEVVGSRSPYRFNYGPTQAPSYISLQCKSAWMVQSALEYFLSNYPQTDITFVGHSLGAQSIVSWSAGYADGRTYGIRGLLASGPTFGTDAAGTFHDLNRTIIAMGQAVALIRHKAILAWGNLDPLAPPDYARRVQLMVPRNKNTYVVSPGDGDHYWDTDPAFYAHAVNWTRQIAENLTILDKDGNPAIAGAAA